MPIRHPVRLLAAGAAAAGLAGAAAVAFAQTSPGLAMNPPRSSSITGYFKANPLDGKAILGAPPAPDSPRGRADRAVFEETRALKDTPRWNTAIQDNDLWTPNGALRRFSCAVGVDIDEKQAPSLWKILHKVELDVRTVGTPAKNFYDRKRPLIGNDAAVCVPREDWMRTNASYPSGHSMTAWSWALILAEAKPDKADAALTLGRESGESRVICGVHFPTDVEAGRTLGSAMVARLHSEPAFRADLKRAKKELAKAKRAPASCPAA